MNLTNTHTTKTLESGAVLHDWEVRGPDGAVSLSLLENLKPVPVDLLPPHVRLRTFGRYSYGTFRLHRNTPSGSDRCREHGDDCQQNAFNSAIAAPIWARVNAADHVDDVVFAELASLYVSQFGEAAA